MGNVLDNQAQIADISILIKLLKSDDVIERNMAAKELENLKNSAKLAIPQFFSMLQDSEIDVQNYIIYILGFVGKVNESLLPQLITLLKHSNPNIRNYAAYTLGVMGNIAVSAVPQLIPLLQDSDSNVSSSASQALKEMGEVASPKLIPFLKSSSSSDRKNAAIALGHMGQASLPAIPQLISLLRDPDFNVVLAAHEALSHLGYSESKATIVETFTTDFVTSPLF